MIYLLKKLDIECVQQVALTLQSSRSDGPWLLSRSEDGLLVVELVESPRLDVDLSRSCQVQVKLRLQGVVVDLEVSAKWQEILSMHAHQ